jgi:thiol-disulfide isomerase/thioredoxin
MKKIALLLIITAGAGLLIQSSYKNNEATGIENDSTFTIHGHIRGLYSGWVFILYHAGPIKNDSAKIENESFILKGKACEPSLVSFIIKDYKGYNTVNFYVEKGKIDFNAQKDSLAEAKIKGSSTEDEYIKYMAQVKPFNDRFIRFNNLYGEAVQKGNKKVLDSIEKMIETDEIEKNAIIKKYIKEHPASIVSANEMISLYAYNANMVEFETAYLHLDKTIKELEVGKKLLKMLQSVKRTDIGQLAPDFTVSDTSGVPRSLSSYRHQGRVIFLDFWASWCGPCRMENPNLVKAYNMFHSKGFDVVSVSLDDKRGNWLQAIKKDQLSWNHLSDLKGWKSDVATLYGIQGIPMNFLLDENGKIISKAIFGEDLEKKLKEILN